MLRSLAGAVVFVLTLWGIWQLGVLREALSKTADTPLQRKMHDADRVVHYRFDATRGPTFHLDGDEVELRLVTHLVLEPGRLYSSLATYDYGVHLRVDDPEGHTLWTQDVHTSTRQSKGGWVDGHWMQENAFGLEPGVEVTDDRIHRVSLPRNIPWGSRFSITLDAPAAAYGAIRAYERDRDTSLGLTLSYFGPARQEAQRLVGRLTYLPWDALSAEQRLSRLRLRWDRMSALGEVGTDYEVETIFYSGFRIPAQELPSGPAMTLVDDRATALTAWGPGELRMWIRAECPFRIPGSPRPMVEIQHVDAMGIVDERRIDPCEGATLDLWLDEGPHSVHLRGSALPFTHIDAWYDDHREVPLDLPGLELGLPHRPTTTRSPRVRLHPGGVLADYALVEPEDLESAMIRLQARLPVPPRAGAGAQKPAKIRYVFLDQHGDPLEEGEWLVQPSVELDDYETVVDTADADRVWWIGPEQATRFIAPEGTHRMRIEADQEVIVSVYAYWAGTLERPQPHPPWDQVMLVGTVWRRIPFDHRRWHRISPHNLLSLQAQGQSVDLSGPIRLEPWVEQSDEEGPIWGPAQRGDRPQADAAAWVSLTPYTRNEHRTVLEATSPDSPWARYSRWRPGSATLKLRDESGATLVYMAEGDPADALGKVLSVTIDGQEFSHTMLETRGRFRLPRLGPGSHTLELGALPPGVKVYLNRPQLRPARGEREVFRVITIYRLNRRAMSLRVDKESSGRQYINAIMVRCKGREPSQLKVVLDGGAPLRRRGVAIDRVTRATRRRVLPSRGEPVTMVSFDTSLGSCDTLGRVPIPLGPDLAEGRHLITLRMEEGPGVWVRFFRRGGASSSEAHAYEWTERRLELDDGKATP